MLIYDALKKDHEKVKHLLNDLINGNHNTDTCKKLVAKIRDELIPHSRAEEAVLYNSMREINQSYGMAMHGYTEHMEAEALLRTLQTLQIFDAKGLSVAKKLKEALDHHIAEEEGEMFSAARKLFLDTEAEQMADAFEKMKPQIKEESMVGTTWDMVVNLMPERLRSTFRASDVRTGV